MAWVDTALGAEEPIESGWRQQVQARAVVEEEVLWATTSAGVGS